MSGKRGRTSVEMGGFLTPIFVSIRTIQTIWRRLTLVTRSVGLTLADRETGMTLEARSSVLTLPARAVSMTLPARSVSLTLDPF